MKPDAWSPRSKTGLLRGIRSRMITNEDIAIAESDGDSVEYFYSAATIRKWLEERPSDAMLESVFRVKANDPEQQSMADIMTRVVHLDMWERLLAAKLPELEQP